MLVLGIETTCDETAAAVVEHQYLDLAVDPSGERVETLEQHGQDGLFVEHGNDQADRRAAIGRHHG